VPILLWLLIRGARARPSEAATLTTH
jgi:hypothetical protein